MAVNFREHITKNGTSVLAGKDAKNNEHLIKQAEPEEEVFHTEAAGSPFVNIKGKAKKGDIKEAAVFCAKYSKDWKKNKDDVVVHRFKAKHVYKERGMKTGTFGIKKLKKIKVKKDQIKNWMQ